MSVMTSLQLTTKRAAELAVLYDDMETAYDKVSQVLSHSCDGCTDNCCDSYFSHHTYIEWAYLWHGMATLGADEQQELISQAVKCEHGYEDSLKRGGRPTIMCPLNRNGRCQLYRYRLMVCRTHGVPATMIRPDGRVISFPGCFRCQERVALQFAPGQPVPVMDRTALLQRLVALEQGFLVESGVRAPRLKITIARMLVAGPPRHGIAGIRV